eukprot:4755546-Alexandrium_andersonii.AAC.1
MNPAWNFSPGLLASLTTSRHSRGFSSSHTSMARNRFHFFLKASCAFGVRSTSVRFTGLAT